MPYFDHNATSPLRPVAREAWLRAQDEAWANASSLHRRGALVRARLEAAREKLALLLGGEPDHYVFTSGATEGAHLVLRHWAQSLPAGARVGLHPGEHACVREAALAWLGGRVDWLPVDAYGVVELGAVRAGLAEGRWAVLAVLAAHNETGVIQPWAELGRACAAAGCVYLCDAAQWLGKLPGGGLGRAGVVIASAHKFGGPKGVGFLKLDAATEGVRGGAGGGQERGHRAGTEDYPGIAAMLAALAEAETQKVLLETELLQRRATFEHTLTALVPGVTVLSAGADRLWNTVGLLMPFAESTRWIARLDKRDCQVSAGAACAVGKAGPSPMLTALGYSTEQSARMLRVSASAETTAAEWQTLALALAEVAVELSGPR